MKKQNTVKTHGQTTTRTYRFCFGTDEYLHTFSFKGPISETEIHRMLEAMRNALYAECSGAAQSYLDSHRLSYENFNSGRTLLEHDAVMAAAG